MSWLKAYLSSLPTLSPKDAARQAYVMANQRYRKRLREYRAASRNFGPTSDEAKRAHLHLALAKRDVNLASADYGRYLER